jgi:hypothetical protein
MTERLIAAMRIVGQGGGVIRLMILPGSKSDRITAELCVPAKTSPEARYRMHSFHVLVRQRLTDLSGGREC